MTTPTTKQTQAVARMEEAFDLIVNYEFAWKQDNWREASEETACGTALCFAGWAVAASDYEPLIPRPKELADKLGGWDKLEDDMDADIFHYVKIPFSDPLAADERVPAYPAGIAVDHAFSGTAAQDEIKLLVHNADFKIMEINGLANALLDVRISGNATGILNGAVYEATNDLATIREFIDVARSYAGMEPRDFATEPVQVHLDEWVPEADVPDINRRVAAFNERAEQGIIATEREIAYISALDS